MVPTDGSLPVAAWELLDPAQVCCDKLALALRRALYLVLLLGKFDSLFALAGSDKSFELLRGSFRRHREEGRRHQVADADVVATFHGYLGCAACGSARNRRPGLFFALVNQDIALCQDTHGPASLIDDRRRLKVLVGQKRYGRRNPGIFAN